MGGRQKKKAGGKKEAAAKRRQRRPAAIPDIEREEEGADVDALADMAGLVTSFEDALQKEKAAASLEPQEHAAAAASAAAAEESWAVVDTAYEDLQRACEAHAKLWSQVDKLTPVRDEWYEKWQVWEDVGLDDTSLENQLKNKQLSGQAAAHKSREYHAKARSLRASKKRLLQTNNELTELTRQILNLEQRYPINSKRTVDTRMREAALADDPTRVMAALQPAEHSKAQMQRCRADMLAQECRKHQGQGGGGRAAGSALSRGQLEQLVERGVREGPGGFTVAERQAVATFIEMGQEPTSPPAAGVTSGRTEGPSAAQRRHEQKLQEIEHIKAQMQECRRKMAQQNTANAAQTASQTE